VCYGSQINSLEKLVNVSGVHYNTRMITWNKFTHVCESCDALIEYTSTRNVIDITCECGAKCNWLSQEDATIHPTETKEEQMETTETTQTTTPSVPDTYNPNLLVTYKVIRGYSDAEYTTDKVVNLEWELHNGRERQKQNSLLHSKIDAVKEIILEAYADSSDQDTLRSIAEALDIELTKTVEFTATVEVSGTIEVNVLDPYGYDIEDEVTDALFADSNNGNIEITDQEVCNVREA
jgi:hypothetical protein